ncbi:hypothetical protein Dda_2857 [Drechslerella dactyloides]|uniref:Bifunctional lycopene cyclase/phytoene synthase n=1 Tax=Drechslerella dactyloides TaxID=74499 RepID=A0AAD6J1U2_DREDA|nr:hypothetical protein Dda_2857 [Drechslerella dactyloides]
MAGWEYALVHVKYTIPPAAILTLLLYPLKTSTDNFKITSLLIIAVVATIPWDSYLLNRDVWSYPERAVIGQTYWKIPIEELFFFVVQTYTTSLVYLIIAKTIVPTAFLPILPAPSPPSSVEEAEPGRQTSAVGNEYKRARRSFISGGVLLVFLIAVGARLVHEGGNGTYLGLILVWAGPVILFLWSLSHQYILSVPSKSVLIPILVPTFYLWVVDTLALRNGTWVINPDKSFKIKLWGYLDIEEAVFFLVTNILITFGQLAFDHTLAVLNGFPEIFLTAIPSWPSIGLLVRGLSIPVKDYPARRILGLRNAVSKLNGKSRSFSLASSVFEGRLRIDLTLLYAFCRNADDMIDEAETTKEAQEALSALSQAVSNAFAARVSAKEITNGRYRTFGNYTTSMHGLPDDVAASLEMLPTDILPLHAIQDLLNGFRMDLQFPTNGHKSDGIFPIKTQQDLERYSYCVAGTVAEMLLSLVFLHAAGSSELTKSDREAADDCIRAGVDMGIALQCINIARDIAKDAAMGRCYIPSEWLAEYKLTPAMIVSDPHIPAVETLRQRILNIAMDIYHKNEGAIERLPKYGGARKGVRAAVENYVEIGRVLLEQENEVAGTAGDQATVGKARRLWVFAKALSV